MSLGFGPNSVIFFVPIGSKRERLIDQNLSRSITQQIGRAI